jgi:spore coat protein A
VVNGKIWPYEAVDPRNYRLHLLNGCDSRFLVIQFVAVDLDIDDPNDDDASDPLNFYVIGSDQGLGRPGDSVEATQMSRLVIEPGGRYDIVFDFKGHQDSRIIVKNIGGDSPFSGEIPGEQSFECTNRIMAFDVATIDDVDDLFDPEDIPVYDGVSGRATHRKVALFEGTDEWGRLQPLLGTFEGGRWIAKTWHLPTTETPELDSTEIWEIYNFTGDAHPIHLHLVNFQILGRREISFDDDRTQRVLQHNGTIGLAPPPYNVDEGSRVILGPGDGYFESAPKDMVTALPEQVTTIKATFDKPGRYVWHCHILSHEDHEMMRVLQVVPA